LKTVAVAQALSSSSICACLSLPTTQYRTTNRRLVHSADVILERKEKKTAKKDQAFPFGEKEHMSTILTFFLTSTLRL